MTERTLTAGQKTLIDLGPLVVFFRYQLLLWHNDRNSGFDGGNTSCYHDHFLGGEVHPSYASYNMPVNYGIWWSHFIF